MEPKEQDSFDLKAVRNVTRAKHQLILNLANKGFKQPEVAAIVSMVNWAQEVEWAAQELRELALNEAKATGQVPQPIQIPPNTN